MSQVNHTTCDNCLKEGDNFPFCSLCKSVNYCSKKCQKNDWSKHKMICKNISKQINQSNEKEMFDKIMKEFKYWINLNLPSFELIVSQYLHAKDDLVINHVLDVKIKLLPEIFRFQVISADIKVFSALNELDLQNLNTQLDKIGQTYRIGCAIIVSCNLITNNIITTLLIDMDKSQDYKLAIKEKQTYINNINNETGNVYSDYDIISGTINTDIQRMCSYWNIFSEKGTKFMCCSICYQIHYCSKECQKIDWKRHKINCNHLKIQRDFAITTLGNDIQKKLVQWFQYNRLMFDLMVSKYLHNLSQTSVTKVFIIEIVYYNEIFSIENTEFEDYEHFLMDYSHPEDLRTYLKELNVSPTVYTIPLAINFLNGTRCYHISIDKCKTYHLATENIEYYINIVNSGQSKNCQAFINYDFKTYFTFWTKKYDSMFQLMCMNYFIHKKHTNKQKKSIEIMKITLNNEKCHIISAAIQPIESFTMNDQSFLQKNENISLIPENSLLFMFQIINTQFLCTKTIKVCEELIQAKDDISIDELIEFINNNNN